MTSKLITMAQSVQYYVFEENLKMLNLSIYRINYLAFPQLIVVGYRQKKLTDTMSIHLNA